MPRIALVTMPCAAVEYPSLALGLFKRRLTDLGIPCDVHYLNILFAEMIGWQAYNDLITAPPAFFAAEQLFAESAFGQAVPSDAEYYQESNLAPQVQYRLQQIKAHVEPFLNNCLTSIAWHTYDIIGFTSLFEQNLASLALASRLKRLFPHKITVFGGPNFEAVMGHTLHRLVPAIDYVCSGEADETFPELVRRLAYNHPIDDLPGIVHRDHGRSVYTGTSPMIFALDDLPVPDYDEYFQRIRTSPLIAMVDPCVLIETARGCWWGEKAHCTFCGLNAQTMKFRSKTATRAIAEVVDLVQRYRINFIRVVDNILNYDFFADFLPELAHRQMGVTLFFEVKANLRKNQIKMLRDADVTIVQAGIESLSTHTLKLMRKGSTSLMNIQTLKWCRQFGVRCDWNMIYGFPGEVSEDYALSVKLADLLTHLDPPTGCGPIRLDRFSPNFDHAEKMGFKNVRPLKYYRYLYPFSREDLHDVAYYFDFDYQHDIDDGGHIPALIDAVVRWKVSRDQLYTQSYGDWLLISDSRPVATLARTMLSGVEKLIYEYCDRIRSDGQVQKWLDESYGVRLTEQQVTGILDDFVRRKLMVREGNRVLSLAVMTYTAPWEVEMASQPMIAGARAQPESTRVPVVAAA
jgi:ribosomal peptide maturation radical SAM protein 1